MTQPQAAEHIYIQYRGTKRIWRRFTGKHVRKFRRVVNLFYKNRGNIYIHRGFMCSQDDTLAFLASRGKGNRSHTNGKKGIGRTRTPKDRNGTTMTSHQCGSEHHIIAACPNNGCRGRQFPHAGCEHRGIMCCGRQSGRNPLLPLECMPMRRRPKLESAI